MPGRVSGGRDDGRAAVAEDVVVALELGDGMLRLEPPDPERAGQTGQQKDIACPASTNGTIERKEVSPGLSNRRRVRAASWTILRQLLDQFVSEGDQPSIADVVRLPAP